MAQKKVITPQTGGDIVANDNAVLVKPVPKKRAPRKVTQKASRIAIHDNATPVVTPEIDTPPASPTKRTRSPRKRTPTTVQVEVQTEEAHSSIVPIVRNRLQLSLLSPFRLPIDQAALAAQVSRIAGVSFVVMGAILTVLNMHFFDTAILRTVGTGQQASLNSSQEYDCSTPGGPNYNQEYCSQGTAGSIDTTPDIQITVESAASLTNTVPVNIVVPLATRVVLYAYLEEGSEYIILGDARKTDDLHWRFYWNTTQFNDGAYRLKAVITNAYGTYNESKSTSYIIANHATASTGDESATSSSTAGTSGGAQGSTTTAATTTESSRTENATTTTNAVVTKPSITLALSERSPISDEVTLRVVVEQASRVVLYARSELSTFFKSIGEATRSSNNEWRYVWDTTLVNDGGYTLKAQVTTSAGTFDSPLVTTSVLNTESEHIATTTQTPDLQVALEPTVSLRITEYPTVRDDADIIVTVAGAQYVELYALPQKSLTPKFLGLAQKKSDTEWRYRWYSKQTPNGDYVLYARAGHTYGVTESAKTAVSVANEVLTEYTSEQKKLLEEVDTVKSKLEKVTDIDERETGTTTAPLLTIAPKVTYVQPATALVDEIEDLDDTTRESITELLNEFRKTLDAELVHYARSIRIDDAEARDSLIQKIETLKKELIESLPVGSERYDAVEKINTYVADMIATLTALTARNEAVIKERIGDRAFLDTDKDGIADYDELNLYATNPFSADSDGDGFIDGSEIIKGYNPNDARAETLVAYESPRENGIVREDVFAVDTILTLTATEDEIVRDGVAASALISGRGLPNSYVSLFIFSTPVVVTVKTDDDGAWSYIFDKELENGEHEVYVAVTDNAGRVVAKSNPLSFVKTAEAFTPVDAAQEAVVVAEVTTPTLISDRMLLAVGSVSVVGLGLVLLLLGLHVRRKADDQILRYP